MVAGGARLPGWVYIAIMATGVLVCGHVFLALVRRKNRVSEWQTIQGQIEWLRTSEHTRPAGFSIEASYLFHYEGKPRVGTAVSILDRYAGIFAGYDRLTAARLQEAYRQKRAVTVYICPYDVSRSVLLDIPVGKCLAGCVLLGVMALAVLSLELFIDRPSPISSTIGLVLGVAGYWLWTRWQVKPFPDGG